MAWPEHNRLVKGGSLMLAVISSRSSWLTRACIGRPGVYLGVELEQRGLEDMVFAALSGIGLL